MILYKYRSLANFERIIDIILKQRLYCSTYPELNDPFEGIFETTLYPLHYSHAPIEEVKKNIQMLPKVVYDRRLLRSLARLWRKQTPETPAYKNLEDLIGGKIDEIKICSLSSDLNDVRLWSYYADGHRGVAFQIDLSGLEAKEGHKIIHEVKYSEKLPWGILPNNQITVLGRRPIRPYEVLSRKTKHWEFEAEHRVINDSKNLLEGKYFDIKGRIKAIYLGTRTSDPHRELLNKIVPSEIPIYMTNLNEKTIEVEPGECIPERKVSP